MQQREGPVHDQLFTFEEFGISRKIKKLSTGKQRLMDRSQARPLNHPTPPSFNLFHNPRIWYVDTYRTSAIGECVWRDISPISSADLEQRGDAYFSSISDVFVPCAAYPPCYWRLCGIVEIHRWLVLRGWGSGVEMILRDEGGYEPRIYWV